jgi:protoheme IX farnesyltransferase
MPALIGWAGASASIERHAWFLFAILFLWQFPHFLAIALMYREDYTQAGYKMLPRFDLDSRFTRAEIIGFTVILVVTTMLPLVDHGGPIYLGGMFLAGVFLCNTQPSWRDQIGKSWPAVSCTPPLSICL